VPFCPCHFVRTILSNTILSIPFCPQPFCPVTIPTARHCLARHKSYLEAKSSLLRWHLRKGSFQEGQTNPCTGASSDPANTKSSTINQSINQSITQSMTQSINQWINEWINQSINQRINQWINQSIFPHNIKYSMILV